MSSPKKYNGKKGKNKNKSTANPINAASPARSGLSRSYETKEEKKKNKSTPTKKYTKDQEEAIFSSPKPKSNNFHNKNKPSTPDFPSKSQPRSIPSKKKIEFVNSLSDDDDSDYEELMEMLDDLSDLDDIPELLKQLQLGSEDSEDSEDEGFDTKKSQKKKNREKELREYRMRHFNDDDSDSDSDDDEEDSEDEEEDEEDDDEDDEEEIPKSRGRSLSESNSVNTTSTKSGPPQRKAKGKEWSIKESNKKDKNFKTQPPRNLNVPGTQFGSGPLDYLLTKSSTLGDLEKTLSVFVLDPLMIRLQLPPFDRKARLIVHELVSLYRITSESFGNGKHRQVVLKKQRHSSIPPAELIASFREHLLNGSFFYQHEVKFRKRDRKDRKDRKDKKKDKIHYNTPHDHSNSPQKNFNNKNKFMKNGGQKEAANRGPRTIAAGVNSIPDDNIGARMLREMGWQGGGLGAKQEGMQIPIDLVVKIDKYGLGF
eukprot:TRINITY_DN15039_c0_g1_i1.p1 TRINITY_DN15039_c0_g1~~TRINITY_DN15039_c0_g1_i1.p1  ORF type:complete len:483 (+),score=153.05 TRINITY_DN15039_c0_g1_i1:97-1545(+)